MNCKNCGTVNEPGSRFCVGCGQVIESNEISQPVVEEVKPVVEQVAEPVTVEVPVQPVQQPVQPVQQPVQQVKSPVSESVSFKDYFTLMLSGFLKPGTTIKNKLSKYNVFKNSIILAAIISAISTLISLLSTMYSVVRSSDYDWLTGETSTEWNFEALKNINYIELIAKNLIMYIGIVLIIASIYYIASLIAKKQVNYSRMVAISALALVPYVLSMQVLAPIVATFSQIASMFIAIIGVLYTILFVYEGINSEMKIEGDIKYYLNVACTILIFVAICFLIVIVGLDSMATSGSFDSLLNM